MPEDRGRLVVLRCSRLAHCPSCVELVHGCNLVRATVLRVALLRFLCGPVFKFLHAAFMHPVRPRTARHRIGVPWVVRSGDRTATHAPLRLMPKPMVLDPPLGLRSILNWFADAFPALTNDPPIGPLNDRQRVVWFCVHGRSPFVCCSLSRAACISPARGFNAEIFASMSVTANDSSANSLSTFRAELFSDRVESCFKSCAAIPVARPRTRAVLRSSTSPSPTVSSPSVLPPGLPVSVSTKSRISMARAVNLRPVQTASIIRFSFGCSARGG